MCIVELQHVYAPEVEADLRAVALSEMILITSRQDLSALWNNFASLESCLCLVNHTVYKMKSCNVISYT